MLNKKFGSIIKRDLYQEIRREIFVETLDKKSLERQIQINNKQIYVNKSL